MHSVSTVSGHSPDPTGIAASRSTTSTQQPGVRAFGCQLDDIDLRIAVLNALQAREALAVAYRLLRSDTVLAITAETAGKAVARLLDTLNARLSS